MRTIFVEHRILAILILLLFFFSLLCQFAIAFLYQNMIKETHNMSSTENKLLKTCKLKFANCYELHEGVANIPVFVDKFLQGIRFGHISLRTLYHISGQLMLLSVFTSGAGACRAIAQEAMLGEIVSYYLLAFFLLYLYFSVTSMVDVKGKRAILKTNLVDYLENNMSVRIPQSRKEQARLDELELQEEFEAHVEKEKEAEDRKNRSGGITDFSTRRRRGTEQKLNTAETRELEGLLREFVSQST